MTASSSLHAGDIRWRPNAVWDIREPKTGHCQFIEPHRYKHHRVPAELISHSVWRYFHFCLSSRDVEALLLARDITVTDEAIRKWGRKFGQPSANQLHRRRPVPP
jgi:transposase-like protein